MIVDADRVPSKLDCSISTTDTALYINDQTMFRDFRCVVTYLFYASLSMCDQYAVDPVVTSLYFCSNTHPTCLYHAFVSIVNCLVEFGKGSTVGKTRAGLNVFNADNFFSLDNPNFVRLFS